MEKAINKRGTIAIRYGKPKTTPPLMSSTSSNSLSGKKSIPKDVTVADAKKKILALKKEARILAEETSHYTSLFEEKKYQLENIGVELENVTISYGDAEEMCHTVQSQINDLLYQKQLQSERIAYKQKYANRLREVAQTGVDSMQSLQVERRVLSASQALDNVKEIITDLQGSFPHLKDVLQRVFAMTDPSIDTANDNEGYNNDEIRQ
eukprot:gene11108-14910_t